jgi:hypothetical protein
MALMKGERVIRTAEKIAKAYAECRRPFTKSGQVNVRTDATFEADIETIIRDSRIADRANATRYAVHREATRIRNRANRMRRKTR